MTWVTVLLDEVITELELLPSTEQVSIANAAKKPQALGPRLGYPHSSGVRGADDLRELRPRAGRSRWRAFYRRLGDVYVIAAIGPEAQVDPRGFDRAVAAAEKRLAEVEVD